MNNTIFNNLNSGKIEMLYGAFKTEIANPALPLIRNYIITMRPYLLFVSGITGIAGLSLSTSGDMLSVLLLSFCFFLSYGFGQALTDCFQTDTDSISSPYRPLVQGSISKTSVMIISLSGLLFIGITVLNFTFSGFILALIASIGLATYTPFKRRWWGGPFYNAWIVAALFTVGYLCFAPFDSASFNVVFWGSITAVFFGYANFVLTGYYKDISADRSTGYNTIPVKFGLKISSVISDIFALLELISWAVVMYSTGFFNSPGIYALIFSSAGIILIIYSQLQLHKVKDEKQAYKAISPVVHAYILLIGSIAVNARPDWGLPLCLFYAAYVLVLKLRPMKEQI